MAPHYAVIARLVRNCALGRAIQFVASRFSRTPAITGYAFAGYDGVMAGTPHGRNNDDIPFNRDFPLKPGVSMKPAPACGAFSAIIRARSPSPARSATS